MMTEQPAGAAPSDRATAAPDSIRRWAFIIGVGIFATNLSQPIVLDIPIRNLLKDGLGLSPPEMAVFFALGGLPWYFKVLAGLLADSVPLFGSRRRSYLVLSAVGAGALWIALGTVSRSYLPLLLAVMAINVMLVVGSTVVGGLLVEAEQRLRAGGRLVAARVFVDSTCMLIAGPLAGFLAGLPFGTATAVGGVIALTVVPVALILLYEPPTVGGEGAAPTGAYDQLRALAGSRVVWATAVFLLLVSIPQEFSTAVFYHQRDALKLPVENIGGLKSLAGVGGLLAAIVYGYLGRHLSLRALARLGIASGAAGALSYVFYRSPAMAVGVELAHGFLFTLGTLALMEVAVWATPKGAAAMGFALFMSAVNAGAAIGDVVGSTLIERLPVGLFGLAGIYAAGAALMLGLIPFLPRALFTRGRSGASP